ncbi:MAG: hypothetical protein KIT48_08990 [Pseudolabrys sp.]|nr:hypothetical protein [Pseudolabrys sp.]
MTFDDLKWNPQLQMLTGYVTVNDGNRVPIEVPRELIHTITMYNDAIETEIEQYKEDIVSRLLPHIYRG